MGQRSFNKDAKFYNFIEIFYCGMTRLRNTNLRVLLYNVNTQEPV